MELLLTKFVTMIILGLCSFMIGIAVKMFRGVLGLQTKEVKRSQAFINSMLLCFGAGVLLATALLHILPETRNGMDELQKYWDIGWLAELVFCVGFFLVYLVEEVVHLTLHRTPHREQIHTTLSLRDPAEKADSACNTIEEICGADCQNDMERIKVISNLDTPPPAGQDHLQLPPQECRENCKGSSSSPLRDFFTVLALSFHSVFEGIAVGLEKDTNDVWALFTAISAHKFVIVFCVSLELLQTEPTTLVFFSYLGTFSLVTPLGIGLGMVFSGDDLTVAILQGLAGGTILYVIMFEVLQREKEKEVSGIFQLLGIVLGFSAMMGLELFAHHDHCHKEKDDIDQNTTSILWTN